MFVVAQLDRGWREHSALGSRDHHLRQEVAEPVQVGLAGPARQLVEAERKVSVARAREEPERGVAEKLSVVAQLMAGELHEDPLEAVQHGLGVGVTQAELLAHLLVEVLQQLASGLAHRLVDLEGQLELELVEGRLDLRGLATALVDLGDPLLEIDPGFERSEHLVAGPEDALEELELFGQQLEDSLVGLVLAVEEVHDHHVVLLAIAMAAPDTLLDALGIPRQVVVHDERAELEVDAFGARLGRDHDPTLVAEVVDESGAHVGAARAADSIAALVPGDPGRVDLARALVRIAAVEEDDAVLPRAVREHPQQIALRTPGLGEDDGLLRRAERTRLREGDIERREQRTALGVVIDRGRQPRELARAPRSPLRASRGPLA